MKTTYVNSLVLGLVMILLSTFSSVVGAQEGVLVCNGTEGWIDVAVSHCSRDLANGDCGEWVSAGWFRPDPGECKEVWSKGLPSLGVYANGEFTHVEKEGRFRSSGTCIDPNSRFEYIQDSEVACPKRVRFVNLIGANERIGKVWIKKDGELYTEYNTVSQGKPSASSGDANKESSGNKTSKKKSDDRENSKKKTDGASADNKSSNPPDCKWPLKACGNICIPEGHCCCRQQDKSTGKLKYCGVNNPADQSCTYVCDKAPAC